MDMNEIDEKKLKISSKKFRVNETAEFLGITPRILKHYEKTGVLTPERSEGNDYRAYTAEDIIKIQVSEQLKAVGFTNREICDYFSGALDIRATYEKLIAIREKIDHFLSVLGYDLQPNKPRFSIAEENTLLCYVERRPTRSDLLQRYYDARNAYCNAIDAGCRCDNMRMFFFLFERENPESYRICLPVSNAPETCAAAERVTRKKSLVAKMSGFASDMEPLRKSLFAEAERRGLEPTGTLWSMSEMGPNRKTSLRLYTLIAGVQIE